MAQTGSEQQIERKDDRLVAGSAEGKPADEAAALQSSSPPASPVTRPTARPLARVRERLRVTLDDMSYLAESVGRTEGLVVFAAHGLPGEEVIVEVDDRKRHFVRGRVVEVLRASPDRVAAPCPLFGRCGGCAWQHVAYATELEYKQAVVVDQLRRLGGFANPPVRPILGATDPWRYRNQARFSLAHGGVLGFTRRHSRAVLEVEDCLILQQPIVEVLNKLQGKVENVHQVIVRSGARTGTLLVAPKLEGAAMVTGQTSYVEELAGRRYRVSANSFFQANTRPLDRQIPADLAVAAGSLNLPGGPSQADLLALTVLDRLRLTGGDLVLDAYGGVGSFALLVAERAGRVVGIEEAGCASADGQVNGADLDNVEFLTGRVEDVLPRLKTRFDAAILDPARVGCAPETLAALIEHRPPRLVYVSCDTASLGRDLKILCADGVRSPGATDAMDGIDQAHSEATGTENASGAYELLDVQPIDMFPRTHHIEIVATLRARAR